MRRYRVYLNSYYAHYTKDSSKVREQGVPEVPERNKTRSKAVYERLIGFWRYNSFNTTVLNTDTYTYVSKQTNGICPEISLNGHKRILRHFYVYWCVYTRKK